MPRFMPRLARLICAAACALALPGQAADPARWPPLEAFFQNPTVSQVTLSPDGQYLAMLVAARNGRVQLATVALGSTAVKVVAGFSNADVNRFAWVNSQRLVLDTLDLQATSAETHLGPGLFAVNRDGSDARPLVVRSTMPGVQTGGMLPWNHALHSVHQRQPSDEVLVQEVDKVYQYRGNYLLRLNTVTGQRRTYTQPDNVHQWVLDQNGALRIAIASVNGQQRIHYLDPATDSWRELPGLQSASFTPKAFGADGTLYVTAWLGRDKQALYTYDLRQQRINPEPVLALQNYDLNPEFVYGPKGLLGVRYEAAAPGTAWFDARMRQVQKAVDELLPGMVNQLSVATQAETPQVVVQSASDVMPARYFLYDTRDGKLTEVGNSRPQIDMDAMSTKEMVRYAARDGLSIPAYLTLPHGGTGKNLPLVLLVHGGPYVRGGSWLWNAEVQFLASRGYAVLQPEFRGSRGFGLQHYRAGWKQWGLKMQDDLADAAQWAIAQGIADPGRICIAGASYGGYGGYATLMGLVNNPELFRCGVEWVGVTDIGLMYTAKNDMSEDWKAYGMPALVGDRDKDAAQLKATSPIEQAARITRPLLMAYGGADQRVPMVHGTRFRDAVRAHNDQVEWVSYREEGHGWLLVKNRVDFWERVERFLDRNIGARASIKSARPPDVEQ